MYVIIFTYVLYLCCFLEFVGCVPSHVVTILALYITAQAEGSTVMVSTIVTGTSGSTFETPKATTYIFPYVTYLQITYLFTDI